MIRTEIIKYKNGRLADEPLMFVSPILDMQLHFHAQHDIQSYINISRIYGCHLQGEQKIVTSALFAIMNEQYSLGENCWRSRHNTDKSNIC